MSRLVPVEGLDDEEEMEPRLRAALRELGETYGPLGVALAAARFTDPGAVVRELTSRRQAAREEQP